MPDKEGPSPLEETRMYQVELWTLLGRWAGSLMLHMSSGCFSGILSLMRSDNPVRGQVSAGGRCTLSGSIRTRVSTYPMTGGGRAAFSGAAGAAFALRRHLSAASWNKKGGIAHARVLSGNDATP